MMSVDDNYDCLNKKRFSSRRKVDSELATTTSVGSVFQVCGAATAKARLPTVDSLTGCTTRRLALVEPNGVFVDQASRRHGSADRGNVVHRFALKFAYYKQRGVDSSDSPRDALSGNLVNCCTTIGTGRATNPQQIEIKEFRRVVNSHDASTVVGVVNKLDRRRLLLTTRWTCRCDILFKSRVWYKVLEKSTLILVVPKFP